MKAVASMHQSNLCGYRARRDVGTRGQGGGRLLPLPDVGRSVNLWVGYAQLHSYLSPPPPPDFQTLRRPCRGPLLRRSRTDIDSSAAAAAVSRGISWLKMQSQLQPSTYSMNSWIFFWGHQDWIRSFCHTMAAFLGLWLLVALLTPDLLSAFPVSPERYEVD